PSPGVNVTPEVTSRGAMRSSSPGGTSGFWGASGCAAGVPASSDNVVGDGVGGATGGGGAGGGTALGAVAATDGGGGESAPGTGGAEGGAGGALVGTGGGGGGGSGPSVWLSALIEVHEIITKIAVLGSIS